VGLDCNAMPDCDFELRQVPSVTPSGGSTTTVLFNPQVDLLGSPKQQYPMWAATFAAASYEPWPNETVYLGVDSADFAASTSSSYAFGGQPSILFKGQGWMSKFAAAHEYGHLQSLFVPITALSSEDIDCSLGGPGHTLESVEYQPCAAAEGFADFFAAVTWNDPTEIGGLVYVQVESNGNATSGTVGGNTTCTELFGVKSCADGTANELDWAGALRQLELDVASVTVERALHMLWHVWVWPGSASSPLPYTDFWPAFDEAMDPAGGGYLTAAEYSAWVAIADAQVIDQ
jgi:hypothetical protein